MLNGDVKAMSFEGVWVCMMIGDDKSEGQSSAVDLSLDELVELLPADRLSAEATNGVDDFDELFLAVAVLELFVDVAEVVEVELALALHVQKGEVGPSALFRKGAALSDRRGTMRVVSSLRNCSKSRAAPWVASCTSCSSLNTNSYFESSPRVPAVRRISRASARRCLGSA